VSVYAAIDLHSNNSVLAVLDENDRVLRQWTKGDGQKGTEQLSCDQADCCSILASRIRALRITKSLRMVATMATLAALPRARSAW